MSSGGPAAAGVVKRGAEDASFLADVLGGLSQQPPRLPCKYFYDQRGSQLFDQICELDEYYPTRTELAIMQECGPQMAAALGPRIVLIEYGSGSSIKTRILLDHLKSPAAYVPVDISCEHLRQTANRLSRAYSWLNIMPVCADFTDGFVVPASVGHAVRRVIYFPGSTIGNFAPAAALDLLARMRRQCGPGGGLLIGVDLQKDAAVLEAAYNDAQAVTAAFNLNLLERINRELGGDFRVDQFEHHACYNRGPGRIEMYLISRCAQSVCVGGREFHFAAGDRICTEYSHKYTVDGFAAMAAGAGWRLEDVWTDSREYFAVLNLRLDVTDDEVL